MRRLLVAVALPAVMAALVAACAPAPQPAGITYTCCDAAEIDREHRAGETMAIRWTVVGEGRVPAVELRATLIGPYGAVGELKSTGPAAVTIEATPVRPATDAAPVSELPIPVDAPPGLYRLVTAIVEPGSAVTAESVVRVS